MADNYIEFYKIFIPIITAVISAAVALWLAKEKDKKPFNRERYDNVVFKIFDLIEPYLFSKSPNATVIEEICSVVELNRSLAGYKILYWSFECRDNFNQKSFRKFCYIISADYDNLCKSLNLPVRSESYKIRRKQYANKFYFVFAVIQHYFLLITLSFIYITLIIMTCLIISQLLLK